MKKLVVGQKICALHIGQTSWIDNKQIGRPDIVDMTITKIGSKLAHTDNSECPVIDMEKMLDKYSGIGGYSHSWKIFLSKQELDDYVELKQLNAKFREYFTSNRLISDLSIAKDIKDLITKSDAQLSQAKEKVAVTPNTKNIAKNNVLEIG